MKLRSPLGVLVAFTAALLVVLLTGLTALAKEGITARLTAPLDLRSQPGERIAVDWTVAGHDDQGRQQPFNAVGVFVRLFSASGGPSTIGFASPAEHADGRYDAQVTVPPGGIGGIEIGVRGSSDTIFLLENDPFGSAPSSRNLSWGGLAVGVLFLAGLGSAGTILLRLTTGHFRFPTPAHRPRPIRY